MFGIEPMEHTAQFPSRPAFEEVGAEARGGYPLTDRDAEGVEHFLRLP